MPDQRFRPIATYALIGINIVFFVATATQAGSLLDNYHGSQLFTDLALYPPYVAQGDYLRLIGSGFLHYGPLHIAVNMYALFILGRDCELILGRARYLAIYGVSLLGGSAAVMLMQTDAVTAGASGAVFGLMAAQTVILLRLRRSPTPVLILIGINVVISWSLPGISLWGHLGGLAAGALASAGLLYGPALLSSRNPAIGGSAAGNPASRSSAKTIGWAAIGAVALLLVVLIGVRVLTLRSDLAI